MNKKLPPTRILRQAVGLIAKLNGSFSDRTLVPKASLCDNKFGICTSPKGCLWQISRPNAKL